MEKTDSFKGLNKLGRYWVEFAILKNSKPKIFIELKSSPNVLHFTSLIRTDVIALETKKHYPNSKFIIYTNAKYYPSESLFKGIDKIFQVENTENLVKYIKKFSL